MITFISKPQIIFVEDKKLLISINLKCRTISSSKWMYSFTFIIFVW